MAAKILVRALVLMLWLCQGSAWARSWSAIVEPHGQVFPALALATEGLSSEPSTDPRVLGDPNGLLGVRIRASRNHERVAVRMALPPLFDHAELITTLPKAGAEYALYPIVPWDYPALASIRQPRPATLSLRVSVDGKPNQLAAERVRIRSINDALYWVADGEGGGLDLGWMFAAYVNEHDPWVGKLLDEALQLGIVDRFQAEPYPSEEQIYLEVFAIWQALKQRGLRYSSIVRTSNEHPSVLSQHVRFVADSVRARQANCIDGSVLLASLLKGAGIEPSIVLLPGHAIIGFALEPSGQRMAYLETTLLGRPGELGNGSLSFVSAGLPYIQDAQGNALHDEFAGFEAAAEAGERWVQEAGNAFSDLSQSEYRIINIAAARAQGIRPISTKRGP